MEFLSPERGLQNISITCNLFKLPKFTRLARGYPDDLGFVTSRRKYGGPAGQAFVVLESGVVGGTTADSRRGGDPKVVPRIDGKPWGVERPKGAARSPGTGRLPRDLAVTHFVSSVLMHRGICRGISR